MEDVGGVEVEETIEELVYQRFKEGRWDWRSKGLGMVVDHLLGKCHLSSVSQRQSNIQGNHALRIRRPCIWTCLRAGLL